MKKMRLRIALLANLVLIVNFTSAQIGINEIPEKSDILNTTPKIATESIKAGADYEDILYDEAFNKIPWVDPEINFIPNQPSNYAGDINGDGKDDFIKVNLKVPDERTADLSDYVNKTILTYGGDLNTVTHKVLYTQIIPVGDLNNDGYDDAIGKNYNQTWQYYIGSATGYVASGSTYSTTLPNNIIGFVDLDRDGYQDYIQWSSFPYYSIVFGGSLVNNFTKVDYSITPIGSEPYSPYFTVTAGKINNTNDKIVLIYYDEFCTNSYCEIDSINTTRESVNLDSFPFYDQFYGYPAYYLDFNLIDIDGDGFSELSWTSNKGNAPRYVLTNTIGSNLYATTPIKLCDNLAIPIGDINDDGRCDFYTVASGLPSIAFGPADITNGLTELLPLNKTNIVNFRSPGTKLLGKFGDVNGDGYADFSLGYDNETHFGERIYFGKSAGDLTYKDILYSNSDYETKSIYTTANIGDINNDGKDDIAIVNYPNIKLYLNQLGDLTPDFVINNLEADEKFLKIINGNFNGDGYNDLVILRSNLVDFAKIDFYFGGNVFNTTPDHSIDILSIFNTYSWAEGMSNIGDINNDGVDDILVFSMGGIGIYYGKAVLSTLPDINMESKDMYYGGRSIALGDINEDGVDDFAISAYNSLNEVHVYFGQKASTSESVTYEPDLILHPDTTGNKEYTLFGFGITSGDYNGDGKNDIAAIAYNTAVDGNSIDPLMHIYYGGAMDSIPDLIISIPYAVFTPIGSFNKVGCELQTLSDLNNDNTNELYFSSTSAYWTNAILIYGGKYMVQDSIPSKRIIAPNQASSLGASNFYYYSALNSAIGDFDGTGALKLITIQRYDKNYRESPIYTYILGKVDTDNGINRASNSNLFIYPNPADKFIYINLESIECKELSVQICNLSGQTLINKRIVPYSNVEKIDVSTLGHGMYIVKLKTEKVLKTGKLCIQ